MPRFLTDLVLVASNAGEWILDKPLEYATSEGISIIVPTGFVTDLASIPFGFKSLFPVNGKSRKAAVIHDYMYSNKYYKRRYADKVFNEAMLESGVSTWRRRLMYRAVRLFGGFKR